MANEPLDPTPNGAIPATPATEAPEQQKTVRQAVEAAWNEIDTGAEDGDEGTTEPRETGQEGQPRDNRGRFAPKEPGEQSPPDPALQTEPASQTPPAQQPAPAPGSSTEAPQHWSQQDRDAFNKIPPEGRELFMRRYGEMERDYTTKTQAAATAVQFTQALAPVFEDPVIKASLANVEGRPLHPVHAIQQWAGFHKRAMSPNVAERVGLVHELMQRMQLDPAAVFGQGNQPGNGLSEEDMKDPAIRYFADHVTKTAQEVQALRGQLQDFHRQQSEATAQETLRVTRWGIDSFADEKDAAGNLLHPHFDAVLPQVIELYQANPNRDLREAYETAVWMNPQLRQSLIASERQSVEQKQANARAAAAARGNLRGRTSDVAKPASGDDQPKGLRAHIAAAADEVGL